MAAVYYVNFHERHIWLGLFSSSVVHHGEENSLEIRNTKKENC